MRSLLSAELIVSRKNAFELQKEHTIHSQITERSTGCSLNFGIMAAQEEENRVECITSNGTNLLLGNLGERKSCAALQINIVRKGECSQRGQWWALEEVGRIAVLRIGAMSNEERKKGDETHFLGIEGDPPQPLARSLVAAARTVVTCARRLEDEPASEPRTRWRLRKVLTARVATA